MRKYILLIVTYICIGILLAFEDSYVLPVYLVILPFHGFLLYKSIKIKNIVLIFYCFLLFLSHGIGSVVFFLDRDNANSAGYDAVGDFDFSYERLFGAYSYLVVFLIVLFILVSSSKKKSHCNFLPVFLREQYGLLAKVSVSWSIVPLLICTSFFTMVSIWMYRYHIGMTGLQQTELPFHLTGFLFYARRFLFPIVLVYIFFRTKSKGVASIILVLYSLLVGVMATSKSAALIILVPLIYINYMIGRKKMGWICILAAVGVYTIIGEVRLIIYETDAGIDLSDLLTTAYTFFPEDRSFIIYILKNVTNRLYGLQSTVLGDQCTQLYFEDLISFYTHSSMIDVFPDYVHSLFGINLPDDKAFGVNLGYTGTMQLLSCHSYLFSIIQAGIISLIFVMQNNFIQTVFNLSGKNKYKYASLIVLLFSFMRFHDGNEILSVYFLTFVLFAICKMATSKLSILTSCI